VEGRRVSRRQGAHQVRPNDGQRLTPAGEVDTAYMSELVPMFSGRALAAFLTEAIGSATPYTFPWKEDATTA
jgi:hypothetical protein